VSSVSASTTATKSRPSSWPGDAAGVWVVGAGASPCRMTLGSKPKKSAASTRMMLPIPPPATSGTPIPRLSSMLSLRLPVHRIPHLPA